MTYKKGTTMTEPFTEIIQPYYHLANTVHPSMTSLKEYAKQFKNTRNKAQKLHLEAVDIKIASEKSAPSLLAKTMTRYQLFQEQNPLWAKGLTIDVIETALRTYRSIERPAQAKFFEEHFDDYCQNEHRLANALRLGTAFKNA